MKAAAFVCLVAMLLLLAGCRNQEDRVPADGKTSAIAAGDSATPLPSYPAAGDYTPAATETSGSTGDEASPRISPDGETVAPSGQPGEAPQRDAGVVLDDVLKELNKLDELYSQLDDVSESDLAEMQ